VTQPYLATINSLTAEEIKQEIIPEPDPGGPPPGAQLGTSAVGEFYDLTVIPGGGTNGGDVIEFNIDITNNSTNPGAYLTAFNYQTKRRGLADIGILDGFTQDRRDRRVDSTLPPCTSLADGACYNASLGIGHFPNVIGNGLLFGQMVWTNNDAGREGPVIPDQVYVDPVNGVDPVPFWLESVKKNGPFAPIMQGNTNFICVKSGLFDNDPDSDAACAGEPAILIDPDGEPVHAPGEPRNNVSQRLGLPPGETQTVRMRMEFGDFRGAMLEIVAGTLTSGNIHPDHTSTGGLARSFDCSDQRELEFCHPSLVGQNIGYLPNTDATWLTPETLEEIEYVIINQPGDAPTVMNFQENFGVILAMAGFIPSAEFYAPDPNPDLAGTPFEGVLIRQQVLGAYSVTEPIDAPDPVNVSSLLSMAGATQSYSSMPVPGGPKGILTINATFNSSSADSISDMHFEVATLTGGNLLLNADGGSGGAGSILSITSPATLAPGNSFNVQFQIGLASTKKFTFFVDAYGVPGGVSGASAFGGGSSFAFEVQEGDLQGSQGSLLYLPIVEHQGHLPAPEVASSQGNLLYLPIVER
jgi:hypothetical protein